MDDCCYYCSYDDEGDWDDPHCCHPCKLYSHHHPSHYDHSGHRIEELYGVIRMAMTGSSRHHHPTGLQSALWRVFPELVTATLPSSFFMHKNPVHSRHGSRNPAALSLHTEIWNWTQHWNLAIDNELWHKSQFRFSRQQLYDALQRPVNDFSRKLSHYSVSHWYYLTHCPASIGRKCPWVSCK